MTAFSRLGIEPKILKTVDREIDFHASWSGALMLAVTEAQVRHKWLLPQCSKRSQSEINPVN